MGRRRGKTISREVTLEDLFNDAKSIVEELKNEMEEWAGNMEGTSLENTSKYQSVSDARDTLEYGLDDLERIDIDAVQEDVLTRKVTVNEFHKYGKKLPSRADRLGNATEALNVVVTELRLFVEELYEHEEGNEDAIALLEQTADDIEEAIGNVESVDFPGMYG